MALTLEVGTNTWVTEAEAETYFEGRLNSGSWDSASENDREKALVSAFRDLSYLDGFELASTPGDQMKNAQCEQAIFLLGFGDDAERREALKAGGVSELSFAGSGGMKEVTSGDGGVTISPRALAMLEGYKAVGSPISMGEISRDDSYE